jgi:hypothetical protein
MVRAMAQVAIIATPQIRIVSDRCDLSSKHIMKSQYGVNHYKPGGYHASQGHGKKCICKLYQLRRNPLSFGPKCPEDKVGAQKKQQSTNGKNVIRHCSRESL